jgi:hypothetical protein
MTVNTELDLENKEALKKAAFLAATVNTAPALIYRLGATFSLKPTVLTSLTMCNGTCLVIPFC